MDNNQLYSADDADILFSLLAGYRRILLWGEMGVGKSTLAINLLKKFNSAGESCQILELDPGSPPFGTPGTVFRGVRTNEKAIAACDYQPLCTLNAGRFRLPLILSARRLLKIICGKYIQPRLLIDPPGVVRGIGGSELLLALIESLDVDMVAVIHRKGKLLQLHEELTSLSTEKLYILASPKARRPSKVKIAVHRTGLWNNFLLSAKEKIIELDNYSKLGAPPPIEVPEVWSGRQIALLDAKGTITQLGEVIELQRKNLKVKLVEIGNTEPASLLIRDAGRDHKGNLSTFPQIDKSETADNEPVEMISPVMAANAGYKPVSCHLGSAWATLVGGVLGDPLLHVRLRDFKKSYFFDLGDPARLAAKTAHQVEGVFLSHAHLDHISGFVWFLRSRIGQSGPCRIFGPLGTITCIKNFLGGITWDRIKDSGPVFEVCEIDGGKLERKKLQPGKTPITLSPLQIKDNIILAEDFFAVRAIACDHKTPSIAYSLVFYDEVKVNKEQLTINGLSEGPWLGKLKQCIKSKKLNIDIELPCGKRKKAVQLAKELTTTIPGKKLVYAADMADTKENREKLTVFAHSAHTFFCESSFTLNDKPRADANQHLTTAAAIDIAKKAGVEHFVPFHFSKRYQHNYRQIYAEILAAAGPVKIIGHFF